MKRERKKKRGNEWGKEGIKMKLRHRSWKLFMLQLMFTTFSYDGKEQRLESPPLTDYKVGIHTTVTFP